MKKIFRIQKFEDRLKQYRIIEKLPLINTKENDKRYRVKHRITGMIAVMKVKLNPGASQF